MKINFYQIGQTPIDEDEIHDLIPNITTLTQLNRWEQENIIEARKWAINNRVLANNEIFSMEFLLKLHKKMFNKCWKWAGKLRKSEKNIGCFQYEIRTEFKKLQDDINFWLKNKTYNHKELALIFHHRLVKIHLFPNGNGRHARLVADCIIKKYNNDKIDWLPQKFKENSEEFRKKYINSLKKADYLDYSELFNLFL